MKQQPQIENFSQQDHRFKHTDIPASPPKGLSLKLKSFVLSFVIFLLVGLGINYAQPAVYQSTATLLTSAATAIDQASREVDYQHVAIQKQKLLGGELLSEALARLKNHSELSQSHPSLSDLRNMISIEPIEQTNLLNMLALGPDPQVLPIVINTLIDVYLDARALSVENSAQNTVSLVESELSELDFKVQRARMELDQFRKNNGISSSAREENESLTKLRGLTRALNDANEERVKAKARFDAVNQAISDGRAVVPKLDQKNLSNLEQRYQELKERQAGLIDRYTPEYLALQPSLKIIPEQIKELEKEIKGARRTGKRIVHTEVSREYYAAKQVAKDIRRQLDAHKQKAAAFTTLFSHHQKLMDDLASLEEINRETRGRLVKIESKQFEKYPQVDIVERASVNWQPVSPNYNKGALIAFISALVLAFLTAWLVDFLTRERTEQNNLIFPIQTWFRHSNESTQKDLESYPQANNLERQFRDELTYVPPLQKMQEQDVQLLLDGTAPETEQLILLLLSGLTIDEIIILNSEHIDLKNATIEIKEESPRIITVGKRLQNSLQAQLKQFGALWRNQHQSTADELLALLYCAKVDSGLNDFEQPLVDVLRQTYIIFLVEQGLRLGTLAKIVGYLTPLALADYAKFSPPEKGLNSEQVQLIYPTCESK